jgi:UDP-N-acetylmuramoyl-tripeptide--D-alanyl-D-alanine ligase
MTDAARPASLFTAVEIAAMTGGTLAAPAAGSATVTSVVVDSRHVRAGALFVALPGERTDGHLYAVPAAAAGASALLVTRGKAAAIAAGLAAASGTAAVVAVEDTLAALQALARAHMQRRPEVLRIGVTGSNGKTTTKEIIGAVLSRSAPTAVNEGNLNSDIGLPLACFAVAGHRYAVFEMGMNHRGEMDILAGIVQPDAALITNIGTAHIGLLGSKDAIAAEKKAVFSRFDGRQAGFLNEEEPYRELLAAGVRGRILLYGPRSTHGFKGSESLGLDGTLIHWEGSRIRFPLFGRHNLLNALGAITVARELGAAEADIREGIESVKPLFGRSQIFRGPVTVVFDGYNANPDSMDRAISFIEELPWKGRKIAVLGGMRELGGEAADAHAALGRRLGRARLDAIHLFGEEMREARDAMTGLPAAPRTSWTTDFPVLRERVRETLRDGDLLLVKGSRGLELERLLPTVTAGSAEASRCC